MDRGLNRLVNHWAVSSDLFQAGRTPSGVSKFGVSVAYRIPCIRKIQVAASTGRRGDSDQIKWGTRDAFQLALVRPGLGLPEQLRRILSRRPRRLRPGFSVWHRLESDNRFDIAGRRELQLRRPSVFAVEILSVMHAREHGGRATMIRWAIPSEGAGRRMEFLRTRLHEHHL